MQITNDQLSALLQRAIYYGAKTGNDPYLNSLNTVEKYPLETVFNEIGIQFHFDKHGLPWIDGE